MKYTPGILREVLHSLIRKLEETPEHFVRRPGRDFTRPRTLSFETAISLLLTMSENSMGKALTRHFKSSENTPSASAFVPRRWRRFFSSLPPDCAPPDVFMDTICWRRTDPTLSPLRIPGTPPPTGLEQRVSTAGIFGI